MSRNARTNITLVIETILLCALVLCVWAATGLSDFYAGQVFNDVLKHTQDMNQYAYLADALIHGRTYLDLPVVDGLLNASNPYDYMTRFELGANGEQIFWDYAFFDGRYYCYFGVIPAVLLYVPYQLITGAFLNTSYACVILAVLAVVAAAYFAKRIVNSFFPSVAGGFGACIALLLLFFASNVVYLVSVPCFYSIPDLSSLIFTFLGLGLWLSAKGGGRHSRISSWRLFLGSLCMAMNLGCRPHFMLACLLALPLFWDEIRHKRTLFSVRGLKGTICALLPFVLVSAPLLTYNFVRFGSVFDLGSMYNLTGYDMTSYAQNPLTTLYLAYQYLFQPMQFADAPPFISAVDLRWPMGALHENVIIGVAYLLPAAVVCLCALFMIVRGIMRARASLTVLALCVIVALCVPIVLSVVPMTLADPNGFVSSAKEALFGFAPREPWYGGLLWFMPCSLLLLFAPKAYRYLRSTAPFACGIIICCFVFAGVTLIVDAHMCGLTMRYWTDFGWYLAVVCVFVFMSSMAQREARVEESNTKTRRSPTGWLFDARVFSVLVIVSLVVTLLIAIAWVLSPERYCSIEWINPALWSVIVG